MEIQASMQHLIKRTVILSSLGAIALLFTGCGESKVSQCNKIIKIANEAATISSEANKSSSSKNSKSLVDLATKLEKIANDIQATEIKDEKLLGFKDRFTKLYQDASKGLKDTAAAIDKKDIKAANKAVATLQKSSSDEKTLVTDINTYCTGS
jgi:type VI protein secretion system component VasK